MFLATNFTRSKSSANFNYIDSCIGPVAVVDMQSGDVKSF